MRVKGRVVLTGALDSFQGATEGYINNIKGRGGNGKENIRKPVTGRTRKVQA